MTLSKPQQFPEERRLATVLFADVQGFTALAETLDFETVSDMLKGIWQRLDFVIEENGGYIDKHLGDGVMAVWGAPHAGENDAENAITAALLMQDAMQGFVAYTKVPGAEKLKLRIGLNSGQAFAGYVGTKNEYTVLGDIVNVASRLEQSAVPGTVVITEGTYRLVRGIFSVARLEPVQAKGKVEPIEAYEVKSKFAAPTRIRYEQGADTIETHMVGRNAEMTRLREFFEMSQHATAPIMSLVIGEIGMGKSRLLMEVVNRAEASEPGPLILTTRALAQTSRIPYYLWRSILRNRFGIDEHTPNDEATHLFEEAVGALWGSLPGGSEAAHLIGELIGLKWQRSPHINEQEPNTVRLELAYQKFRELFIQLCNKQPTILLIDDLQWADRESLQLLAHMMESDLKILKLFILAGARPEFLRVHPSWRNLASITNLGPLPTSSEMVMEAYPDLKVLPRQILVELAARSEGNPYFLEEIVKVLIKPGLDDFKRNPGEAMARLQAQIPESLRATLQARLDNLPRDARTVALLAAVVGRVFWVGAVLVAAKADTGTGSLSNMPGTVMERLVQDGLRQLVRAELAFPRAGSKYGDEQEYIFKNSFLRDVAYSMIPNRSRIIYHRVVAQWLAGHNDATFRVMSAEHYESGRAFIDAAMQYDLAAQIARDRHAPLEAAALESSAARVRSKAKHGDSEKN